MKKYYNSILIIAILIIALTNLSYAQFITKSVTGGVEIVGYTGKVPKKLVIPKSIKAKNVIQIGDNAFKNKNLESVDMSKAIHLKSIQIGAFSKNLNLKQALFSSSLEELYANAFNNTGLTDVDLTSAKNLRLIGNMVFNDTIINAIWLPNTVDLPVYAKLDNNIQTFSVSLNAKNEATITNYYKGRQHKKSNYLKINIPALIPTSKKKIVAIGEKAFMTKDYKSISTQPERFRNLMNIINLKELDMSNAIYLKSIGANAFNGNINLKSSIFSKFPPKIESIGDSAFWKCNSLTNVDLTSYKSLKTVGKDIAGGTNLYEDIWLPSSVKSKGVHIHSNLIVAELNGDKVKITGFEFRSLNPNFKIIIPAVIPTSSKKIEAISSNVFNGKNLESVDMGKAIHIKRFGSGVFQKNKQLTKVIFPPNIEEIKANVFQETGLIDIDLSGLKKLSFIGKAMFSGDNLNSIWLPSTLDQADYLSKFNHYQTFWVSLKNNDEEATIIGYATGAKHVIGDKSGKLIIPELIPTSSKKIVAIGDKAFMTNQYIDTRTKKKTTNNINLKELDMSKATHLKSIGANAFNGNKILKSSIFSKFPPSIEFIGDSAFWKCNSLTNVDLTSYTSLKTVGKDIAGGTKFHEDIWLPSSVTSKGVHINSNLIIAKLNGDKVTITDFELKSLTTNLKPLIMPAVIPGSSKKIEVIGENAFKGKFNSTFNTSIIKIDFSNAIHLKDIRKYAFRGNFGISEVILEDLGELKMIGKMAFSGLHNLTRISLKKLPKLTKIEDKAFAQNTKLKTVEYDCAIDGDIIDKTAFSGTNFQQLDRDLTKGRNKIVLAKDKSGNPKVKNEIYSSAKKHLIFGTYGGVSQSKYEGGFTTNSKLASFKKNLISPEGNCLLIDLPVELAYFKVNSTVNFVELEWETAQEINNDYFTIERSIDGRNFELIKKIDGQGNSNTVTNYQFDDLKLTGKVTYRLTQFDFDGKSESWLQEVFSSEFDKINIITYPNPFVRNIKVRCLNIEDLDTIKFIFVEVETGRRINVDYILNGNEFEFDTRNIGKGIYILQVFVGQKINKQLKIIKAS
ncbi:hypothetical protein EI427_23880 [Flammeovirga pectinis]|uniref:T9SS type A sorting domain-containing protein n=1 Tax=Flammeovirga pectinis TaxID=2494373 RepID=A0A3Q9FSZ4_9BACT|nr:leucine-rich repeat protein [Flammeovirga pectinis]AZQ65257.1 hypothetical protein EI427_23880 [Flammeovirga pectinis]